MHNFRFSSLFIGLIVSLGLNFIFIVQSYQRNIVAEVVDGDSVDLADGRRIRLLGLDAPERGRCMYEEARSRLTVLAKGRHIRLKNTITDDYGRTLAYMIVEEPGAWAKYLFFKIRQISPMDFPDPFVNRALAREGLGVFSGSHDEYYDTLKQASELAKSQNLGIYSDQCRSLLPLDPKCTIKGNTRAGEKVYYLPNCKNYNQVIVDLSYGDKWFCDEPTAIASSFTKAKNCN